MSEDRAAPPAEGPTRYLLPSVAAIEAALLAAEQHGSTISGRSVHVPDVRAALFAAYAVDFAGGASPAAAEPAEDLLAACEAYSRARRTQLAYREQHDGDDPTLVEATRAAYNALIVASPLARLVAEEHNALAEPTEAMIQVGAHELMRFIAGYHSWDSWDTMAESQRSWYRNAFKAALRAALAAQGGTPA